MHNGNLIPSLIDLVVDAEKKQERGSRADVEPASRELIEVAKIAYLADLYEGNT